MEYKEIINIEKKKENIIISGLVNYIKENMGILIGFLLLCITLSIISDAFLTLPNISNVLRQASTNANLAIGMTLALIICGIDLSVGSIVALTGTLTAGLIVNNNMPVILAVFIGITLGTLLGFINGQIISRTGMPPFIVTLAMMQIARGAAYVYASGQPIRVMNDTFNFIGSGFIGPVPLPVLYSAILMISVGLILSKTKLGRHIYAVGGNREAAKFSGISIAKVEVFTFTLLGFLSAVSGIVLASRMYSGQPTVGVGFEMDAIAASVLGGTSFSGGIGRIGGTLIGILVIAVLNNGLNLLNVSSFWQFIAKGFVILFAVYFDLAKKKGKKKDKSK